MLALLHIVQDIVGGEVLLVAGRKCNNIQKIVLLPCSLHQLRKLILLEGNLCTRIDYQPYFEGTVVFLMQLKFIAT